MPKAEKPSADAETSQHRQLLQQLKQIDAEAGDADAAGDQPATAGERGTRRERFAATCRTLHVKSALAHIGLLVSLSIYCAAGGYVRGFNRQPITFD